MNYKTICFISLLICFILISCDKNDESINPIQSPTIQKSVGDTFQGGIIFYLDGNGGGLIAATSDQSTVSANTDGSNWGCTGNNINGADSSAIGSGYQNTIDIELGCISAGTAADVCANSENAWMQNFFTGNQRSRAKSSGYWVRAVRAF
jgi:hypothetical protein